MAQTTTDRAVVSWIRIQTDRACGALTGPQKMPRHCNRHAEWEEVRATGPDNLPIDMGRPRLRCAGHFPESTPEVEHRQEAW